MIVLPNIEATLVAYLKARPEVSALVGRRPNGELEIGTDLRAAPTWPAVKLARIGGTPPTRRPFWRDRAFVQVDSYGNGKGEARLVADTIRAVMVEALGVHGDAVITRVDPGGLMWLPDDAFSEGGQPRYLTTTVVDFHPRPGS